MSVALPSLLFESESCGHAGIALYLKGKENNVERATE